VASRELAGFLRALDDLIAAVPKAHRTLHVQVVSETYRDLVERSPVDTGAYRASHAIVDSARRLLYDSPSRPGSDERVSDAVERPSVNDATAALHERLEPFSRVEIENRRYYAGFLEFGTVQMAPRAIYATAANNAKFRAEHTARFGLDLTPHLR